MSLAVLIVCVIAAAIYDVWDVRRRRGRHAVRDHLAVTHPARPGPTRAPMPSGPDDVERAITSRLLAGRLDPELYRDCMAAIAATVDATAVCVESPVPTLDQDAVDRLVTALPELPSTTVRAAADLAQLGAGVEELVRLLDITPPQALRIVVATTGATH